MKTGFFPIIVALLIGGLFAVALFNFSDSFARKNGATQNVYEDPEVEQAINSIGGNVSDYLESANNADTVLSNSSIVQGGETGQTGYFQSLGGIWKNLKNKPTGIYTLISDIAQKKIFGGYTVAFVFNTIAGIICLALLIGVIRWLFTGEGGGKSQ